MHIVKRIYDHGRAAPITAHRTHSLSSVNTQAHPRRSTKYSSLNITNAMPPPTLETVRVSEKAAKNTSGTVGLTLLQAWRLLPLRHRLEASCPATLASAAP
uniref:Uncharacterized protein n=1 Tax=Haptolina brevifila TaxID=156173 RepID=A0A7S2NL81_9EUKA|mmetsp:Transcript_81347/g.161770  ORF Transcript_81347/g.161770 Transcript_81347/m.161770 type:complete len:101 (+) Transcript_81347:44-346(+)